MHQMVKLILEIGAAFFFLMMAIIVYCLASASDFDEDDFE